MTDKDLSATRLARLAISLALITATQFLQPARAHAFPPSGATIAVSGGVASGTAKEFVYDNDMLLSELDWPLDPVVTVGVGATLVWERLAATWRFDFGIPGDAGTLADSDFMNVRTTGSGAKTHYSEHDARLDSFITAEAGISSHLDLPFRGIASRRPITIIPALAVRVHSVAWTGSDGYLQYGAATASGYEEWDASLPKVTVSGEVIEYRQTYLMPLVGLSLLVPIGSRISASIGIDASPAVLSENRDGHLLRNLEFYDHLSEGYLLEPKARVSWTPLDTVSFFAEGEWTRVAALRGTTTTKSVTAKTASESSREDGGGAEYETWACRIGLAKTIKPRASEGK